MAMHGGAGNSNGSSPFRHQETTLGVGFRPGLVLVMGAQRLADLRKRLRSLHLGSALPIERESLPAHAATDIRGVAGGLAKYLHIGDLTFQPQRKP